MPRALVIETEMCLAYWKQTQLLRLNVNKLFSRPLTNITITYFHTPHSCISNWPTTVLVVCGMNGVTIVFTEHQVRCKLGVVRVVDFENNTDCCAVLIGSLLDSIASISCLVSNQVFLLLCCVHRYTHRPTIIYRLHYTVSNVTFNLNLVGIYEHTSLPLTLCYGRLNIWQDKIHQTSLDLLILAECEGFNDCHNTVIGMFYVQMLSSVVQ